MVTKKPNFLPKEKNFIFHEYPIQQIQKRFTVTQKQISIKAVLVPKQKSVYFL